MNYTLKPPGFYPYLSRNETHGKNENRFLLRKSSARSGVINLKKLLNVNLVLMLTNTVLNDFHCVSLFQDAQPIPEDNQ